MNFESYGPFEFNMEGSRWQSNFWKKIENQEKYEELSTAIGCYVFCLKFGNNLLPWYVGKTVGKKKTNKGFKAEVFQNHKIKHYKNVLKSKTRHKPHLMLFPLMTNEHWNFSKDRSAGAKHIEWLETTLIGMAYTANPELRNSSKTNYIRKIYVNGLIGEQDYGRRTNDAKAAADLFKLK